MLLTLAHRAGGQAPGNAEAALSDAVDRANLAAAGQGCERAVRRPQTGVRPAGPGPLSLQRAGAGEMAALLSPFSSLWTPVSSGAKLRFGCGRTWAEGLSFRARRAAFRV